MSPLTEVTLVLPTQDLIQNLEQRFNGYAVDINLYDLVEGYILSSCLIDNDRIMAKGGVPLSRKVIVEDTLSWFHTSDVLVDHPFEEKQEILKELENSIFTVDDYIAFVLNRTLEKETQALKIFFEHWLQKDMVLSIRTT